MPILTEQVRQLARHLHRESRISAESLHRVERKTWREDLGWAIALLTLLAAVITAAILH